MHRSERADRLVDALADLLLEPPNDPMVPEVVSVPTRGVERWLTQMLATRLGSRPGAHDGVCANVEFPFPGSLVSAATAQACGFEPRSDPWAPERSVWPLLGLVDENLGAPFLAPLRRHLQSLSVEGGPVRRFVTVRHVADLFDRYAVNRPELLQGWMDGGAGRGVGGGEVEAWQAELWRLLRARIGLPGPAERGVAAADRLEAEPGLAELPARFSLFGLTRLPASHLRILRALAARRDVHLFLLHPSPVLWEKVRKAEPQPPLSLRRVDDPTAALVDNPLLRSWGRDAREMQLVLAAQGVEWDDHLSVGSPPQTLLGRIQADIRADRAPGAGSGGSGGELPVLEEGDDSLQVHACHGRARQVEVLRDAILHLLQSDPTLEPRHVLIMCPDIESFSPLVSAAFGVSGQSDFAELPADGGIPGIRVRLADRSIRQTNPLLAVTARLLEMAAGRLCASEVLDLVACEPVSRRFEFDEDDLAQIGRWVAETGIRWGLDSEGRRPWKLGSEEANTWRFGLDRLLVGAASSEEDLRRVGGVLPFDDVSSGAMDLVGRFAEFVDRLGSALGALCGPQPVAGWAKVLAEGTESLALAGAHDSWQHDQLRSLLDDLAEEASSSGSAGIGLELAEVTSLFEDRLRGRPTRANFRTGDLIVCTLVPMRSVPHRVIGLLGLDDGTFPRQSLHDGDNLLLADPRVGERDPRSEDRQLLLDAVLAATEHLVITYEGRDLRTNQVRPPSVPVAELLDVVDRTVRVGHPDLRPRDKVVVSHPLQSFDPRNFVSARPAGSGPFSFDRLDLAGARALCSERQQPRPFLSGVLDRPRSAVVPLDALVAFFEHPVRGFLRERLSLYTSGALDVVKDDIPIALDGLERWAVGDRLLEARLEGFSMDAASSAERARGLLPPGKLADAELERIGPSVDALVSAVEDLGFSRWRPESWPVHVGLAGGRLVVGAVGGVRGGTIFKVVYSRLGPKHRLGAWIRFLALSASTPDRPVASVVIGRGGTTGGGRRVAISEFGPLDAHPRVAASKATELLEILCDLYDRGMCEPLPLYCQTSAAWAEALRRGNDPFEEAKGEWETPYGQFTHEDGDADHVLVMGGNTPFGTVLSQAPAADEAGPGWAMSENSRFGRLARRLWDPILDHERRSSR